MQNTPSPGPDAALRVQADVIFRQAADAGRAAGGPRRGRTGTPTGASGRTLLPVT